MCKSYIKKTDKKYVDKLRKNVHVTLASGAIVVFAVKKNSRGTTGSDTFSSMILQHGFRMANRA